MTQYTIWPKKIDDYRYYSKKKKFLYIYTYGCRTTRIAAIVPVVANYRKIFYALDSVILLSSMKYVVSPAFVKCGPLATEKTRLA